jgi:hypothetical protein
MLSTPDYLMEKFRASETEGQCHAGLCFWYQRNYSLRICFSRQRVGQIFLFQIRLYGTASFLRPNFLSDQWNLHRGNVLSHSTFRMRLVAKKEILYQCWNVHHAHLLWHHLTFSELKLWKVYHFEPLADIQNNVTTVLKDHFDNYFQHISRHCIYRMFHLKRNANYNSVYKFWWHQYKKTIYLFFSFHFEDGTYRTDVHHLLEDTKTLPVSRKFVTSRCIVLFGTSLSGYALLMLHQKQQTILMRGSGREWTYVLLVNTPCSHLHSFCATGVSSGLATRVTLTRLLRGSWESLLHGDGPASDFIFVS